MNEYQEGRIATDKFLGGLLQLSRPGTIIPQVIEAWNSCLLDLPQYRMDMVRRLREKYNVYLLSNTNDAHWKYIVQKHFTEPEHHPVDYYFDYAFLSQEMHLAKPNPEIFKEVLRQIHAIGDECLFVDDSTLNLEAAEALGIHTLQATNGLPIEELEKMMK